jgi:predicted DNA-binding transcriptional regulator AlpA
MPLRISARNRTTRHEPAMSIEVLKDLPNDACVSKMQAATLINISADTLDRMHQRGEGPKRIKLSARRVGFRMRDIRAWLNERAG